MTDKKLFLVSDLANELGVPRTTVNDWLKRYDRYLPSEMSGRRRTYTAAALEVLKSVNKMRNDGLSAAKIESELEKNFAIRPDEVPDTELKTARTDEKDIAAVENDGTPSLPALRREEFDRFIGTVEEFSRMEKNRRRHALYVWLVILLIAVFSVATAWFMTQLVKLQAANNSRLARIQSENAEARNAQIKAEKDGKKCAQSARNQPLKPL
jgi:DNA-binding transcriptional MerR regulator